MIKSRMKRLKKLESCIGEMENAHKGLVGESEGKWRHGSLRVCVCVCVCVCVEIMLKWVFNKVGRKCVN